MALHSKNLHTCAKGKHLVFCMCMPTGIHVLCCIHTHTHTHRHFFSSVFGCYFHNGYESYVLRLFFSSDEYLSYQQVRCHPQCMKQSFLTSQKTTSMLHNSGLKYPLLLFTNNLEILWKNWISLFQSITQ